MTWYISVPYTESQLSSDYLENQLELGYNGTFENLIDEMLEEGFNMDIFFYDYDFETNLRASRS